jgi:hypothetical protein
MERKAKHSLYLVDDAPVVQGKRIYGHICTTKEEVVVRETESLKPVIEVLVIDDTCEHVIKLDGEQTRTLRNALTEFLMDTESREMMRKHSVSTDTMVTRVMRRPEKELWVPQEPFDSVSCTHENIVVPFDITLAEHMNQQMVRDTFPRFHGPCPRCGITVTIYASKLHKISGGW